MSFYNLTVSVSREGHEPVDGIDFICKEAKATKTDSCSADLDMLA